MDNTGTSVPRLDLLGPIMLQETTLEGYIAHEVLPIIPVQKRQGAIPSILRVQNQIINVDHAPKTPYKRIQSSTGEKTYACTEKGIEEPISAEDRDALGDDAESVAAATTLHAILRSRESAVQAALTNETTFANRITTASAAWDNASGKPYDNVADAKANLRKRGVIPNAIAFGYDVYCKLQKNAQIQSQLRAILGITDKSGIELELDPNLLARVFGVKHCFIGASTYNTAKEGQTESAGFIWPSTYAIVFRRPDRVGVQSLSEVCVGRTFMWDQGLAIGDMASGAVDAMRGFATEQYREEQTKSDVIRSFEYTDTKILNVDALQLIKSI